MSKFRYVLLLMFVGWQSLYAQVNTERILTIGRNALYFEDYVLSIQYFNQVINAKPYLFEPYFFRGYAKFSLGDEIGAINDCNKALEINPFFIDGYLVRGIAKQAIGDYEGANQDFNQGLEYDFDNTSLMMNRGIGKFELEDYEGAINDFTEAIDEKSGFMLAYLNRGRAWLELADTTKALNDYNKAVEINPFHTSALGMRGALLAELKQYDKALEDYNAAIRMEPKQANLYINRGLIRYFSNNLMGAIADYDRAIELDPNSLITYYNRGLLRAQIGDVNNAVDDFNKVLQIDPNNRTAQLNRALLNIEIGEYFLAIDDLDHIIEAYPDFPIAYYARSQCKQALNDIEGATRDYNTGYAKEFEGKENKKRKQAKDLALAPTKNDPKEGRKEKDNDVRNYKKVIVLDEDNEGENSGFANNKIRGRVQYRNIAIDLEPDFSLSYYPGDFVLERSRFYYKAVERYNLQALNSPIFISKDTRALSTEEINTHFDKIQALNAKIKYNDKDKNAYFQRALHFVLVKDFNSALNDLNRAIDLDPNFMLAYFARGFVRYKMLEFIRSIEDISETDISFNVGSMNGAKKDKTQSQERILDYDLIMRDYNKVQDLAPDFSYMYFNRANMKATLKDFKAAIADYSLAIKYEPEMAEAYFNRGLTYIFLGEAEKGNRDLSKAGELGLFKAYNVLKRYGSNQKQ